MSNVTPLRADPDDLGGKFEEVPWPTEPPPEPEEVVT